MTQPALIFDLDGTLLDTLQSLAEVFNTMLSDQGFPTHSVEAYRQIIGDGVSVAVERALPDDEISAEAIDRGVAQFREIYHDNWQTARPYPGIEALIDELVGHFPLAVLSNKDDAFTQRCINHFFPGYFDVIYGHRQGFKHKPDPAMGLALCSELGVAPDLSLMIGDTATDMKTAVACGMTGVGVLWGFRERQELTDHGASYLIRSPADLTALLPL